MRKLKSSFCAAALMALPLGVSADLSEVPSGKNEHLNGVDFFNTAEFPTITFTSTSMNLIRSKWGLGAYVPAVSDEVELSIEVELLSK